MIIYCVCIFRKFETIEEMLKRQDYNGHLIVTE